MGTKRIKPFAAFTCCAIALTALLFAAFDCFAAIPVNTNLPKSIRVVMDDNYPPYVFKDGQGNLRGIIIDQWELWGKKTGVHAEVTGMDWSEAQLRMQAGEFDVIDTIFRNEKRESTYLFSKPYAQLDVPLFFDKDISGIRGPDDLEGFLVAAKAGDNSINILKKHGVTNIIEYPSYEKLIEAARDGKAKVFTVDRPPALYFLNKMGIQDRFHETAPMYHGEFHRAVLRGQGDLLSLVEKGFADIQKADYEAIDKRWLGASLTATPYLRYALYIIVAIAILALALMFWLWVLKRAVSLKTRELAKSDERHRTILQTANCGIWLVDRRGQILEVNAAYCRMSGYSEQELLTMSIADLEVNESAAETAEQIQKILERGEAHFESRHRRKDGSVFDVEVSAQDQPGDGHCVAFLQDITERKKITDELFRTAQEWQTTFDATNDAVWILDTDNRVLRSNKSTERMLHCRPDEIFGKYCWSIVHHTESPPAGCPYEKSRQSCKRETMELQDGEQWLKVTVDPILDENGHFAGAVHIVSDITERKKAEDKLRKSETYFRTLVHTIPDLVWLKDAEGVFLSCNAMFERLFGAKEADIIGKTDHDFLEKNLADFFREHDRKAMAAGRPTTNEELLTFSDDGHKALTETTKIPMFGLDGELVGVLGIGHDITERKKSEVERENLIAQLQDKTAEQERFIYTVSHDLKSPLVNISCFADLAEQDLNSGDQVSAKNDLAIIIQSTLRMRRLLDELLEISRVGIKKNPEEVVNLNTLIDDGIFNLSGLIKEYLTTIEVESDLPDVMVDKQRFLQVVENLIANASRYSKSADGGSHVKIGVTRNAEELICYVKDNGIGIEADYLDKIFGLFERLDTNSDSTGVGLAIVKRITETHGGRIWAESEGLGHGTTFFFTVTEAT